MNNLLTLVLIGQALLLVAAYYFFAQQKKEVEPLVKEAVERQHESFYQRMSSQQTQTKADILQTLLQTLKHQHDQSTTNYQNLSNTVHKRLHDISQEVTAKLHSGFEKNHEVFNKVVNRLALIDQAQQKITALSENVIALQDILTDKSSRGAFGEVQLHQLIANTVPKQHYRLQATLPNSKRVDCLLLMPNDGHIAIDAKFPLENYQKQFTENQVKPTTIQQFKQDIKKHIDDIKSKYIVPNYTTDGAIMFIPAEAIFAHIHADHPDLVAYAHKQKVWLTSPTTLMAVLNTALSVIKDHATQTQVNIIKQHLAHLATDFQRFEKRMDQLAKHINQANKDVDLIHVSSQKISQRFTKIENCQLPTSEAIEE